MNLAKLDTGAVANLDTERRSPLSILSNIPTAPSEQRLEAGRDSHRLEIHSMNGIKMTQRRCLDCHADISDPEHGRVGRSPLQGQVILYFGAEPERFEAEFAQFGLVARHQPRHQPTTETQAEAAA